MAQAGVRTRDPGTNAFREPLNPYKEDLMTFSADGTASNGLKKRPGSQKRAFQKVDARDLAGKWWSCCCIPFVPFWPLSPFYWTTKKALNEDQYEESGRCFVLGLPCPVCETRTRKYVNGLPTNGFALDGGTPWNILWYRDPGCAAAGISAGPFFAKKVG